MVFDLLTKTDLEKIDEYRKIYSGVYCKDNYCDIEKLLAPWNEAKSKYLEQIFKDKLIIEKPITFYEDIEQVEDKIFDLIVNDVRVVEFFFKLRKAIQDICLPLEKTEITYFFNDLLVDATALAKNKIDFRDSAYFDHNLSGKVFSVNGTALKVQQNEKPLKIITKLAKMVNVGIDIPENETISDLEYFRLKHSLCLNQKTLKGNLCFSIHPLDYMTMSDNAENWGTCMSWTDCGCGDYRCGTVEMMNSASVVVAYLSSEKNKFEFSEGYEWNSKKWRSLFIVNPDFIINIKSYPYKNINLEKMVVKELAELSGWGNIEPTTTRTGLNINIDNRNIAIDFFSNNMYCDFGSDLDNYIIVNPKVIDDLYIDYNYSGLCECMCCGKIPEYYGEKIGKYSSDLICDDCDNKPKCEHCGIERYDYITDDEVYLCNECWDSNTFFDDLMGETYYDYNEDDIITIYLSTSNDCLILPEYPTEYYMKTLAKNLANIQYSLYFNDTASVKFDEKEKIYYIYPKDCTKSGLWQFGVFKGDKNYPNVFNDD